jgi:hypothetical protein
MDMSPRLGDILPSSAASCESEKRSQIIWLIYVVNILLIMVNDASLATVFG